MSFKEKIYRSEVNMLVSISSIPKKSQTTHLNQHAAGTV